MRKSGDHAKRDGTGWQSIECSMRIHFKESLLTHEFNMRGVFFGYVRVFMTFITSKYTLRHSQTDRKIGCPNALTKLSFSLCDLLLYYIIIIIIWLFGHCSLSSDCKFVIVSKCVWGQPSFVVLYIILLKQSDSKMRSLATIRIHKHSHWKRKSWKNQNEPTHQHLISNSHLLVSLSTLLFAFSLLCWM